MKAMVRLIPVVAVLGIGAGCTLHDTEVPDMTGPSEYAQSVTLTATPDTIRQDGVSSSTITVRVIGPDGQPVSRAQVILLSDAGQFGTLSPTTLFTGSDGRGTATYTAPTASPFMAGGPATSVSVYARVVGTNYQTAIHHSVEISVVPPPAPVQSAGAPLAALSASTSAPKVGQLVTFDASGSSAESGHRIVTYYWDFGDGQPQDEHGNDASHVYSSAGTYYVVLGVVDDLGRIGSTIRTITVTN